MTASEFDAEWVILRMAGSVAGHRVGFDGRSFLRVDQAGGSPPAGHPDGRSGLLTGLEERTSIRLPASATPITLIGLDRTGTSPQPDATAVFNEPPRLRGVPAA